MSEEEYLKDILASEKAMVNNYSFSLNEASCDHLYNVYLKQFKDISRYTKEIFYLAYNNGYYNLEQATATKIKDDYNSLKSKLDK